MWICIVTVVSGNLTYSYICTILYTNELYTPCVDMYSDYTQYTVVSGNLTYSYMYIVYVLYCIVNTNELYTPCVDMCSDCSEW